MEPDWKAEAQRLRAKLDMITHHLELWDLHHHTHGLDHTPPGWGLSVREMVWRLKDGEQETAEGS